MLKLMLVGRVADRTRTLEALRALGTVHLEPVDPSRLHPPATLERDLADAARALALLRAVKEPVADPGVDAMDAREVVTRTLAIPPRVQELEERAASLARERAAVEPWGPFDAQSLEVLRRAGLSLGFWSVPHARLGEVPAGAVHLVCHRGRASCHVFTVARLPVSWEGATPVDDPVRDAGAVDAALQDVVRQKAGAERSLAGLASALPAVAAHLAKLEESRRFNLAEQGSLESVDLFGLVGWLPKTSREAMEAWLKSPGVAVAVTIHDVDATDQPPTLLEYVWWARPIKSLFDMLGTVPGYREFDMGAAFLVFLSVFTAMLVGDAGYALVVALPVVLMYRRLSTAVGARAVQLVLILCGATVLYGSLTATFFGLDLGLPKVLDLDTKTVQVVCFTLGAVHISIAHLWKAARRFPSLPFLADLGWVAAVWSIWALVLTILLDRPLPVWMEPELALGLTAALFLEEPSWNLLKSAAKGIINVVMSTVSLFSDIISYIRLMAVGLAGLVLAQNFNELAQNAGPVFMVPLLVVGHGLNIFLCVIAVFAHGVRLNMLEFSNHLGMAWVGRSFQPFSKEQKGG
jgi:V/A-type H+-transporting ATPase subunit I